jgi:glycosyltransferase involved in cell wall biosynthesis
LLLDGSRVNYEAKKKLFTGLSDVQLYVPSRWLADRVKQSFLREYPVEVVYNTVNEDIFRPTPGDFREKHGLEHKKIALGVASVWDRRKGLEDFVALAGKLDDSWRIVLVGLTEAQSAAMPGNIICIRKTNSAAALAEIYTAADVFVNLSVEETFGMTTLEALKCGTMPIVYAGTACEEVTKEFGGVAVERFDWDGLLNAMEMK